MTIAHTPLPYALDALDPYISARTLEFHYGKHHKAYVDKLNAAIPGTDYADLALEGIITKAAAEKNAGVFNNAAQTWNHGFYWQCLAKDSGTPSAALASAIDAQLGGMDKMVADLTAQAVGHFGSGWAWLVSDAGALKVITTHDAETPVTHAGVVPLLTIDVWEHAYYLDYQNARPNYLAALTKELINWSFASENFERGSVWVYA